MRLALVLLLVTASCRLNFDDRSRDAGNGSAADDALGDGDAAPPPPFEPMWANGTRMRARLLVPVEGGDPYFFGWRDTQLNMDCINGIAADGVERCVPQEVRAMTYFADAGCTTRLGFVRDANCGMASHAIYFDTMGRHRVHPLAAEYTGTIFANPGCVPSPAPIDGTLYSLGAEVPATDMAAAQYTNVPVGAYVRPMQGLVDGSKQEIGTLNVGTHGSCAPRGNVLGPAQCRPIFARGVRVFTDNLCTQAAFLWPRQSYDPPTTSRLVVLDPAACVDAFKLYSTVSDVTVPTHYALDPSGCNAYTTEIEHRIYTATEITNPFPAGNLVVGPRRGRLGYLYWVGPDNVPLAVRYWDHDLQTPCLPINGSDGRLRCLPAARGQILDAFPGSTTCTGSDQNLIPQCFPSPPVDGPDYVSCSDRWIVKPLPQVTTTVSVFDNACYSLPLAGGYYDPAMLGAEIPPAMFAELTEILQ